MTGVERQRRYWRRLRARLDATPTLAPTALLTLTWHRKALESTGTASDGVEYIITRLPDTGEFELNFYNDAGDFLFVGDGFPSMTEAERAAEQHNTERQVFDQ